MILQNQNTATPVADGKLDNNKHFSAKSALGGLPNAQTLLQQPPLQVLVIERMHSGLFILMICLWLRYKGQDLLHDLDFG